MRIISFTDNVEMVESTVHLLNDKFPLPKQHWPKVTGAWWAALDKLDNDALFRGFVKELAIEWIRCGKRVMPKHTVVHASGMKRPGDERFTWNAYLSPQRYIDDKDQIVIPDLDMNDPAADTWLWKVYWDWTQRNPPTVWFSPDGTILLNNTLSTAPPEPNLFPPFIAPDSPHLETWEQSLFWFVLLLNCGSAQRLDCCVYCQQFFTRKRNPKADFEYKRGPECGSCLNTGSMSRTLSSRQQLKDEMLEEAAKAWQGWKKSHVNPNREEWVVKRVNERFKKRLSTPKKRKWFAHNTAAIMALVEESKAPL